MSDFKYFYKNRFFHEQCCYDWIDSLLCKATQSVQTADCRSINLDCEHLIGNIDITNNTYHSATAVTGTFHTAVS